MYQTLVGCISFLRERLSTSERERRMSVLRSVLQESINEENQHLRELLMTKRDLGCNYLDSSIEMSKMILRVYYALLQGDNEKSRKIIDEAKAMFLNCLDSIRDADSSMVAIADMSTESTVNDYAGTKGGENYRQVAKSLKVKVENFEFYLEHM